MARLLIPSRSRQQGWLKAVAINGTVLESPDFELWPDVSGADFIPIVLGPDTPTPEVVYVTAHTFTSPLATVLRGQENTAAVAWPDNTMWGAAEPAGVPRLIELGLKANDTTNVVAAKNSKLQFPIGANEMWRVIVQCTAQCSGNGGMKYAIGAPAGASLEGWLHSSLGVITTLSRQRLTAINTLSTAVHTVANTPGPDELYFVISNGATPGNVTIQFASNTNAQVSTIFARAFMSARQLLSV